MGTLGPALLATPSAGNSFWREAALNAVSPILTALFGGLVVSILIQQAQDRRSRQTLRATLSTEMMKVAYGFYFRLVEVVRREHYKMLDQTSQQDPFDPGELPRQYDEFRIAARVLEEQLRVSFRDSAARWLWHGVVDMLTVRYYRLVHVRARFDDMVKTHSKHPTDPEIPPRVQSLFMTLNDFQDEEKVDQTVMRRFEKMLNEAIREVLRLKLDPPSGGAVLRPGRGSRLSASAERTLVWSPVDR